LSRGLLDFIEDLMVKVAGHKAYFTALTEEMQDSIIARTERGL
jgi:pyruvate-formate lyase